MVSSDMAIILYTGLGTFLRSAAEGKKLAAESRKIVDSIRHEVVSNSGHSMRDSITRTETKVDDLRQMREELHDVSRTVQALEASADAVHGQLLVRVLEVEATMAGVIRDMETETTRRRRRLGITGVGRLIARKEGE